ncbi:MAG TPA: hypothetical protein PKY82_10330 [Pyrinomonadaceae bacterium]|nr:hypothetical protein [Pyrinomonadaceae bacterium]
MDPNSTYLARLVVICITLIFSANVLNAQVTKSKNKWKKIQPSEYFSLLIPVNLEQKPSINEDSAIWVYGNENLIFIIDFGIYSSKSDIDKDEVNYKERVLKIDGRRAVMISFKTTKSRFKTLSNISEIYFTTPINVDAKLKISAFCKTTKEQKIAETIFRSIKIK